MTRTSIFLYLFIVSLNLFSGEAVHAQAASGSVGPTGDPYIDGVYSGYRWNVTSLTFSFPSDAAFYGTSYPGGEPTNNFRGFLPSQQSGARLIFGSYSRIINMSFVEMTESLTTHAVLRAAGSNSPATAWGYYPGIWSTAGDSWYNVTRGSYDYPVKGSYGYLVFMHEFGHNLGLKHSHQPNGTFPAIPADHDDIEFTIMSYHPYIGGPEVLTNEGWGFSQTFMMDDIAALQQLYGANFTTNSGDSVYQWNPMTGQMFINGVGQEAPGGNRVFMTLWDGGGTDTFDLSNYSNDTKIDLRPAAWTTLSPSQLANLGNGNIARGNVANAKLYNGNPASLIENAIGGLGNDQIIGNDINNRIAGGPGDDVIDGGAGTNRAVFSGPLAQYLITPNPDSSWSVADQRVGRPDGTDTIRNIQFLDFSDQSVIVGAPINANRPPVALNDMYATDMNVPLSVAAPGVLGNDSDSNGDQINAIIVSQPSLGTVVLNSDGSFVYTPTTNLYGSDSFQYKVNDGSLDSNIATVAVDVQQVIIIPPNNLPIAVNDSYSTKINTTLTVAAPGVLANDSDLDGDSVSATIVSPPSKGTLVLNANGSFVYTPNANTFGTDSFQYKANDGKGDSGIANVEINVINHAPVATNDSYATDMNVPLAIVAPTVLENDTDADGDILSALIVAQPTNGSVTLNANGSFVYSPTPNTFGIDSFQYKANDGGLDSDIATVTIDVRQVIIVPPNNLPVSVNDDYSTNMNTTLTVATPGVLANDSDRDGDSLTASLVTNPNKGTLTFNSNGSFVYVPGVNIFGVDRFRYTVSDGKGNSTLATVTINILEIVNHAPVASDDSYSVESNRLLIQDVPGVLGNDSDSDGQPIAAFLVTEPHYGRVEFRQDGRFIYTPTKDYVGLDSFQYKVSDGRLDSNIATVKIEVKRIVVAPVNTRPVVQNDFYSTALNEPIYQAAPGVLENDSDVDMNKLSAILVTAPTRGTLSLSDDGSFIYTPRAGVSGVDTFTYKVSDGLLESFPATVTITVLKKNPVPTRDRVAPLARILAPATRSVFPRNSRILTIATNTTDNVGVVRVEVWLNGMPRFKASGSSPIFSLIRDRTQLRKGANTLQAVAYDAAGNIGRSEIITFFN